MERNFGSQITVLNFPQRACHGLPFKRERVRSRSFFCFDMCPCPFMMELLNRMSSNILNGSANSSMPFIGSLLLSSKVFLLLNFNRRKFKLFSCAFINFDISIKLALLPLYIVVPKYQFLLYFSFLKWNNQPNHFLSFTQMSGLIFV